MQKIPEISSADFETKSITVVHIWHHPQPCITALYTGFYSVECVIVYFSALEFYTHSQPHNLCVSSI